MIRKTKLDSSRQIPEDTQRSNRRRRIPAEKPVLGQTWNRRGQRTKDLGGNPGIRLETAVSEVSWYLHSLCLGVS